MSEPNKSESAPKVSEETASRISKLFDIRLLLGALLSVYGLILLIKSFFDTDAQIAKGAGLRLNLFTGLGMLVVGLLLLAWMRWRPLAPAKPEELDADSGPQQSRAD